MIKIWGLIHPWLCVDADCCRTAHSCTLQLHTRKSKRNTRTQSLYWAQYPTQTTLPSVTLPLTFSFSVTIPSQHIINMVSSFPFMLDIPNTPQPVYGEVQCQTQALNQQSSMKGKREVGAIVVLFICCCCWVVLLVIIQWVVLCVFYFCPIFLQWNRWHLSFPWTNMLNMMNLGALSAYRCRRLRPDTSLFLFLIAIYNVDIYYT